MKVAEVVAMGYRYPAPGWDQTLLSAVEGATHGVVRDHMRRFVDAVGTRPLGEWEELHTATLDLSPQFVPYVGHVVWGENYRRGEFMAELNREMAVWNVDLQGELPDHIAPVLRYLAACDEPLTDLIEVLPGAVATMHSTLSKASPGNPYLHLLAATVALSADLRPLTIGARR